MAKGKIYTVFDEGKRIGSYTPDVAEKVLGIPENKVNQYAKQDIKYQERYTFVKETKKSTGFNKKLETDWRFTTGMILAAGKGRNHSGR